MGGEVHALAAQWIRHVAAAHEEAVDGVSSDAVGASGGVEESGAAGGVGGEGGEEGVEVDLEGGVGSESEVGSAVDIVEYRGGGLGGTENDEGEEGKQQNEALVGYHCVC